MRSMTWADSGAWYGYPKCCSTYFQSKELVQPNKCTAAELTLGFMGTGYRPCPDCQKLTATQIYQGLCERRTCPTPFPISDTEVVRGRITPQRMKLLRVFVARMRAQNVPLEERLISFLEAQLRLIKD